MKILLVQLLWQRIDKPIYPLGIVCLATVLKDRHQVVCLDENMVENNGTELLDTALKFQPDVIGLSVRNVDSVSYWDFVVGEAASAFSTMEHLRRTAERLKKNLPNIRLVIGGPAFSIFAKRMMEVVPDLDFGVAGEGEIAFPLLLDNLDQPDKVPEIFYRHDDTISYTGKGSQVPFSEIADPDYDFVDVNPYIALKEPDSIGVESKRGCILHCAYCVYPFINGTVCRQRDPIHVVDKIENLVNRYHLTHFQFTDSVFNHPQKHAEAICQEIIRRKLKVEWSAWFDLKTLDERFIRMAVEAGCHVFELSPDGFSNRTLKVLGKNIKHKDIIRVWHNARKVPNALIRLNFLCNSPGETIFSLLRLLSFFVRLRLFYRGKTEIHAFNFIRIMPNTPIYERALREGIISADQELLPTNPMDFIKTYYRPRPGNLIEKTYDLMIRLRKLKGWLGNASHICH